MESSRAASKKVELCFWKGFDCRARSFKSQLALLSRDKGWPEVSASDLVLADRQLPPRGIPEIVSPTLVGCQCPCVKFTMISQNADKIYHFLSLLLVFAHLLFWLQVGLWLLWSLFHSVSDNFAFWNYIHADCSKTKSCWAFLPVVSCR